MGYCAVSKPLKDADGQDLGVDVVFSWRGTRVLLACFRALLSLDGCHLMTIY